MKKRRLSPEAKLTLEIVLILILVLTALVNIDDLLKFIKSLELNIWSVGVLVVILLMLVRPLKKAICEERIARKSLTNLKKNKS